MNKPVTIKAVGDICPGDKSILGLGVCSMTKKYGADFPFCHLAGCFDDADIVIGNIEGVISPRASTAKETFYGIPEFAPALRSAGFSVVTVANNHILEKGIAGFNDTVAALRNAGIAVCGTRGSDGYHSEPVIQTVRGITIGCLAYNWVSTDLFDHADDCIAQSRDSAVNYTWNRSPDHDREARASIAQKNRHVLNDIRMLRREVDFVVLLPHWGFEFVHVPPIGVVAEAHSFIDAGADAIIGIHPHVLQGTERYNNGSIIYSLGNFIFDMRMKATRSTAICTLHLDKDTQTAVSFNYLAINSRFQPVPLTSAGQRSMQTVMDHWSQILHSQNAQTVLDDEVLYRQFEKNYRQMKWNIIILHFLYLPMHPAIILVIGAKCLSFLNLLRLRLTGKAVRW